MFGFGMLVIRMHVALGLARVTSIYVWQTQRTRVLHAVTHVMVRKRHRPTLLVNQPSVLGTMVSYCAIEAFPVYIPLRNKMAFSFYVLPDDWISAGRLAAQKSTLSRQMKSTPNLKNQNKKNSYEYSYGIKDQIYHDNFHHHRDRAKRLPVWYQ